MKKLISLLFVGVIASAMLVGCGAPAEDAGKTDATKPAAEGKKDGMASEAPKPGDAMKPGDAAKPGDAMKPGDAAKPGDAMKPGDAKPGDAPAPAPAPGK